MPKIDSKPEPQEPLFVIVLAAFAAIAGFVGFLLGTAFPQGNSAPEFIPTTPIKTPINPQAGVGPWGVFGGIANTSKRRHMTIPEEAQAAYERYGHAANWQNYAGYPMPKWVELPEGIRTYWIAAIKPLIERLAAQGEAQ